MKTTFIDHIGILVHSMSKLPYLNFASQTCIYVILNGLHNVLFTGIILEYEQGGMLKTKSIDLLDLNNE